MIMLLILGGNRILPVLRLTVIIACLLRSQTAPTTSMTLPIPEMLTPTRL